MQLRARPSARAFSRACVHKQKVSRIAPLRATQLDKAETNKKVQEFTDGPDDGAPSTAEVTSLLNTLVSDTEIAELKLKMGSFQLSVRRSVDSDTSAATLAPAAAAAATAAAAPILTSVTVAPPPTMSPALSLAPMPYMQQSYDSSSSSSGAPEESMDEYVVYCAASKVGVFRRGRYAAGKKVGKGSMANVGDQVKRGQTVAFVEQLGTFVEVKAPAGGEIVAFKAADGDPVEYQQPVVAIAPFFAVQEAGVTEVR